MDAIHHGGEGMVAQGSLSLYILAEPEEEMGLEVRGGSGL